MADQVIKLNVKSRELSGRKVKKLRREGITPANIFGKKIESKSIQVEEKDFLTVYKKAGETSIIELVVDGEKSVRPVLVSNLHVHPVSGGVLHIDFHQVDLKEKVTATVPIELIGESSAVKEKGGVLFSPLSELEVTALPTEMPNKIELDISGLVEIGDTLTLKNLKVDTTKIEFSLDSEEAIVVIQEQKAAEVEEVIEEESEEVSEEAATEDKDASDKEDKEEPTEKKEEGKGNKKED